LVAFAGEKSAGCLFAGSRAGPGAAVSKARRLAMTVAAILKHKGSDVVSIAAETSVAELVRLLAERRIGAVPVLDNMGQLLGIISERDVVSSLAAKGAGVLDMPASAFMTRTPHTGTPATTVQQAMEIMTDGRFRHLPIVEENRLVGMVSIGDVVKARISQQMQEVESLKAYVAA
jgi:CBS domain-containing protein